MGTTTVHLAPPLQALFPGAPSSLDLDVETVAQLLDELDRQWPGMAGCLRDTRPAIRKHINIFVDGEASELGTTIPTGADVYVMTAMSGG